MKVITLQVGPLFTNCFVIGCEETKKCIVVDPGGDASVISENIKSNDWTLEYIFCTHGHFDHIGGVAELKAMYPEAPICIHEADADMLYDERKNLCFLAGFFVKESKAEKLLKEGDEVEVGNLKFRILEIPGHSKGGIALVYDNVDGQPASVFCGDTIFRMSQGRVDFPGGNARDLYENVKNKILTMADDTILYPGHNESTTVGQEKQQNPCFK